MNYLETASLIDKVNQFKISHKILVLFKKAITEAIKLARIILLHQDKLDQESVAAAHAFLKCQNNETAAGLLHSFGALNLGGKIKGASRLVQLLQIIIKVYSQIETIKNDQEYFESRAEMLENACAKKFS